jgi:hypothetical protein
MEMSPPPYERSHEPKKARTRTPVTNTKLLQLLCRMDIEHLSECYLLAFFFFSRRTLSYQKLRIKRDVNFVEELFQ